MAIGVDVVPKPLRDDLLGRFGYWLYYHGFPVLGTWLWVRSRSWRQYVTRQYD